MATSGTINGAVKTKAGVATTYYTFTAEWKRNSYSIENNTSNITIYLKIKCTQFSDGAWNLEKKPSVSLSVNGTSRSPTINFIDTRNYVTCTFATWTGNVSHKDNGSLSCPISASFTHYGSNSLGSGSVSGNASLDTIPRASKINSFDGTDLAGSFSVGYTSYYSDFTNKLRISIPNVKALETFNYTSGNSFKLSQESLDYLYSYTSTTDKVKLGAVIETWSGSTKIGESAELVHDCYVPSNIKPSLGTITLDPVNITTSDKESRNVLVKGKNKISVSVSDSKAGAGSSIKSYTFAVLSGSKTIASTTTTDASVTFGPFSQTGSLKFRVTVTDNRSRSTNNSGSEPTQTCHEYSAPSFSSFEAYRCNSSGTEDDNGTYMKYSLGVNYSSVNSTNNVTVKIYYKKSSVSSWTTAYNALTNSTTKSASAIIKNSSGTSITFGLDSTYVVRAEVIDNYGGSVYSSTGTTFGASRIFNIRPDGNGISFGKMAEEDNLFECKWPAKFDDSVTVPDNGGPVLNGYSVETLGPGTAILSGSDLNNYISAGVYYTDSASISASLGNRPDTNAVNQGGIRLIVEYIGHKDYIRQTIITRADNCAIYQRRRLKDGTWSNWATVLNSMNIGDNISSYLSSYLPLSGGTLTGALTLPQNLYFTDDKHGMNCRNSDIVNANGIYFADVAGDAGEGINFKRGNGNWDSLFAVNGILKFHPNRALDASPDGQILYTSSNFRCGLCTLSSSSDITVNFTSEFNNAPTVMLTPLTNEGGVIAGKVRSVSKTGFVATIGGSEITKTIQFVYFAIL